MSRRWRARRRLRACSRPSDHLVPALGAVRAVPGIPSSPRTPPAPLRSPARRRSLPRPRPARRRGRPGRPPPRPSSPRGSPPKRALGSAVACAVTSRGRSPRRSAWVAAARALAERRGGWPGCRGRSAAPGPGLRRPGRDRALALAAGEATDRAEVAADRLADRRSQVAEKEDSDVVSGRRPRGRRHRSRRGAARRVTELTEAERAAERDRASWQARRDALAQGLTPATRRRGPRRRSRRRAGPARRPADRPGGPNEWPSVRRSARWPMPWSSPVAKAAAALGHLQRRWPGRLLVTGVCPPCPARLAGCCQGSAGPRRPRGPRGAPAGPRPRAGRVAWCPPSTTLWRWSVTHPRVRAVTAAATWWERLGRGGQADAPSKLVSRPG